MPLPHHAHTVSPGEGKTADLGVAQMRVLAAGKDTTDGAFTFSVGEQEIAAGPGAYILVPGALTDPAVRAAISARHDSVPA